MTGAFMLIAFILGFWCIWSANREVNSIGEALGFYITGDYSQRLDGMERYATL